MYMYMYMYSHNHLNSNFKVTLLYTYVHTCFIYSTHNTNRRHSFFAIKSDIKLYNPNNYIHVTLNYVNYVIIIM